MRAKFNKSKAFGTIDAKPSKSYAHRLLIASCLSNDECIVENIVLSNDILATIECIKTLGKDVSIKNKTITVKNKKGFNINECDELIFNCFESGSTLRFFIPIALTTGKKVVFKGSERLIQRGIKIYEDICEKQNIKVIKEKDSISFIGKLQSDCFTIEGNISSQFISGLLFALPLLEESSSIVLSTNLESKNYVDITIDVLRQAGIVIDYIKDQFYIEGNQKYLSNTYYVEGDYSNSAFIDAFNYLEGNVVINGLNNNSYQGDKEYKRLFNNLCDGYSVIDISNCIDLGPILFCFAALKHGGCFTGVNRLKIKESDRILDVKEQLEKFNVIVTEENNKVYIDNKNISKPTDIIYGKNDHRIVMALSVMLSVFGGEIEGIEAVSKSYPDFFNDLKKLGIEVEYDK